MPSRVKNIYPDGRRMEAPVYSSLARPRRRSRPRTWRMPKRPRTNTTTRTSTMGKTCLSLPPRQTCRVPVLSTPVQAPRMMDKGAGMMDFPANVEAPADPRQTSNDLRKPGFSRPRPKIESYLTRFTISGYMEVHLRKLSPCCHLGSFGRRSIHRRGRKMISVPDGRSLI
jgi:hypothetical protein